MKKYSKRELEILYTEYARASDNIRTFEAANEKAIGISVTLVVAFFSYGVHANSIVVFFFIPVAVIGILFFTVLQYNNIFWNGGYKRAIEVIINENHNKEVLFWEKLVSEKRSRINIANFTITVVISSVVFLLTSFSVYKIYIFHQTAAIAYSIVVSSIFAIFVFSIFHVMKSYQRSVNSSLEIARAGILASVVEVVSSTDISAQTSLDPIVISGEGRSARLSKTLLPAPARRRKV